MGSPAASRLARGAARKAQDSRWAAQNRSNGALRPVLVGPGQGVSAQGVSWMRSPRLRRVTTRSIRSSLVSAPGTWMATWE